MAEDGIKNRPKWNTKQVAAYLGLSRDTVRDMAEKKEIPARKIRSRWKFDPEEIERWWNDGL